MYKFGKRSLRELNTCHEDLKKIAYCAIKIYDFTVLEGARTLEKQKELVENELSWSLNSKHVISEENPLSRAFDLVPYPYSEDDWNNKLKYTYMGGIIMGIARHLEIPLFWGGDWSDTKDPSQYKFFDGCHFELRF